MPSGSLAPVAAIVFDFDGVIADTELLHLGAFQEVFAARGWTLDRVDYFDRYLGYDDRGLIAAFADEQKAALDQATLQTMTDAKALAFGRQVSSADVLFPGARARISELARRYPLAIASGALHREIEAILRTGGILALFPVIVGADDVATGKPSPEPYLSAAAKLGVAASACVAIEDSVPGLQAARAAGMRTIAVTTTSPRHAIAFADRIVDGIGEITDELIASLAGPA